MFGEPAILALSDGSIFHGISVGAEGSRVGELVFNTAMTGYQEILSDPSYAGQIITLTTAHVGNTGCNQEDMESRRVWGSGLVLRNVPGVESNYRAAQSFVSWLMHHKMVAIGGVDTRALVHRLREFGAIACCISTTLTAKESVLQAQTFSGLAGCDWAQKVSGQTIERWHEGRGDWAIKRMPTSFHVVAYDFGIKHSLLRILSDLGCHITLVPARTPADDVLAMEPDGIFLSNGPGDPAASCDTVANVKKLIDSDVTIFGVCFGFQLLALACGATSYKMKFGHHGANHPVTCVDKPHQVFITSQNHSFAINEESLPNYLKATHYSLFDGSLQGIVHLNKPVFGFQGHPEAAPGPHDIEYMFDDFISLMASTRQ